MLAHELRVDDPERRVRQDRRQRRSRRGRAQDDRVPAARRGGDAVEQERRIALQVDQTPEREDGIGGGERRPVREVDVPAQVEDKCLRVLRRLPRLHELRHRVREVAALVREERVVDAAIDDRGGRLEGALGIGGLDLEGAVDDERPGGRRRRRLALNGRHSPRAGNGREDRADDHRSAHRAGTKTGHCFLRRERG